MQARVISIRYDASQGAFEGRVDLHRDGRTFRYPARLEAPPSMPRDAVEAALVQRALRMSDSDRPRPVTPRARTGFLQLLASALTPSPALSELPIRASDPRHPQARLR